MTLKPRLSPMQRHTHDLCIIVLLACRGISECKVRDNQPNLVVLSRRIGRLSAKIQLLNRWRSKALIKNLILFERLELKERIISFANHLVQVFHTEVHLGILLAFAIVSPSLQAILNRHKNIASEYIAYSALIDKMVGHGLFESAPEPLELISRRRDIDALALFNPARIFRIERIIKIFGLARMRHLFKDGIQYAFLEQANLFVNQKRRTFATT